VSRFDLLGESSPDAVVTPPIFMASDCLYRDGRDLRPKPLGVVLADSVSVKSLSPRS